MAPDRDDDDLEDLEEDYDDDERPQTEVTIEVTGLSLYTHHGVTVAEQEVGQRLVLDLRLEVGECDATVTDLVERMEFAIREGVREERIHLDPGIGFGKDVAHNLELLRRLDEIVALGFTVLVGTSRKAFLGRLVGREDPHERVAATVATNVIALERGARVFRVHDVAATADALKVAAATLRCDGA